MSQPDEFIPTELSTRQYVRHCEYCPYPKADTMGTLEEHRLLQTQLTGHAPGPSLTAATRQRLDAIRLYRQLEPRVCHVSPHPHSLPFRIDVFEIDVTDEVKQVTLHVNPTIRSIAQTIMQTQMDATVTQRAEMEYRDPHMALEPPTPMLPCPWLSTNARGYVPLRVWDKWKIGGHHYLLTTFGGYHTVFTTLVWDIDMMQHNWFIPDAPEARACDLLSASERWKETKAKPFQTDTMDPPEPAPYTDAEMDELMATMKRVTPLWRKKSPKRSTSSSTPTPPRSAAAAAVAPALQSRVSTS